MATPFRCTGHGDLHMATCKWDCVKTSEQVCCPVDQDTWDSEEMPDILAYIPGQEKGQSH